MLLEPSLPTFPSNRPVEEVPAPPDSEQAQQAAIGLRLELLQNIVTLLTGELQKLRKDASFAESSGSLDFPVRMPEEVAHYECQLILEALKATGNRQNRAAKLLGIKYTTLNSKIRKYKLTD